MRMMRINGIEAMKESDFEVAEKDVLAADSGLQARWMGLEDYEESAGVQHMQPEMELALPRLSRNVWETGRDSAAQMQSCILSSIPMSVVASLYLR